MNKFSTEQDNDEPEVCEGCGMENVFQYNLCRQCLRDQIVEDKESRSDLFPEDYET